MANHVINVIREAILIVVDWKDVSAQFAAWVTAARDAEIEFSAFQLPSLFVCEPDFAPLKHLPTNTRLAGNSAFGNQNTEGNIQRRDQAVPSCARRFVIHNSSGERKRGSI